MPKAKKAFKFQQDMEVDDPATNLKIQLEMLQQRAGLALLAMKHVKVRELQEQIKAIRQIAIRINNLSYNSEPSDDQRLLTSIRECRYTTESNASLYKDEGQIDIQGMYDIKKLSRRILW
jgi:hypothetical protein